MTAYGAQLLKGVEMRLLLKALVGLFVIAVAGWLGLMWYQMVIVGNYFSSANFLLSFMAAMVPVFLAIGVIRGITAIVRFDFGRLASMMVVIIGTSSILSGCSYASANVQTLISDDCGVSWKLIEPGNSVPSRVGPCAYKITVPDYPMPGETSFKTSFKDRVLATVEIGYEYAIVDAKVFISEAKYLGKPNSDSDDKTNSAYESAENAVIDKRIRDVATEMLITEDIVDFSQAEFEDKLLIEANNRLANKGVRLNFISFVPTPEEQTRLAIDMMTAMKIYESRQLGDLGQKVTVARAGATKIEVTTEVPTSKADEK